MEFRSNREPMGRPIRNADDMIRQSIERDREQPDLQDSRNIERDLPETRNKGKAVITGGDVDAAWDQADIGEEAIGGDNPTPDQDIVENLGSAVGVTYEDGQPLQFEDKLELRDQNRWELNPVSSEDYQQRQERLTADFGTRKRILKKGRHRRRE